MIFEIENYETMQSAITQFCRFLNELSVSPESVFDSKLVASELVGNVLRHSNGRATLRGEVQNGFIELTVLSTEQYTPPTQSRKAEVYAESGRGLFLVDAVCERRSLTDEGGIFVKIKLR